MPRQLSFDATLTPRSLPQTSDGCREFKGGPCPYASCRRHLKFDVDPDTGRLIDNFPGVEIEDMKHTCALTVAERGRHKLKTIGRMLGVGMSRAQQVEDEALRRLARKLELSPRHDINRVRGLLCAVSAAMKRDDDTRR